ncbi:hypothetical protein [Chloroflexus islandicus]|nr:hypothetical protein [Chloroflexus islandicus]
MGWRQLLPARWRTPLLAVFAEPMRMALGEGNAGNNALHRQPGDGA